MLRYPDEVNFTVEGEKDILGRLYEDPHSIMMLPIVEGKVAGNGSINGIGVKRKIRHRCSFAIAFYGEYWGLGIGTAMIEYMCELAAQIGWHQVDLEVVAENTSAQALYIEKDAPQSTRHHLVNPHYFSGLYEGKQGNNELWDEVWNYLDRMYDLSKVKKVYLSADGGAWIMAGRKRLHGLVYALDEFHMQKYLIKMTNHMLDSAEDARKVLCQSIKEDTKEEFLSYVDMLELAR